MATTNLESMSDDELLRIAGAPDSSVAQPDSMDSLSDDELIRIATNSPTEDVNAVADVLKRGGRSAAKGVPQAAGGILRFVKILGDKVGLDELFTPTTVRERNQASGKLEERKLSDVERQEIKTKRSTRAEKRLAKIGELGDILSGEYTKGGELTGAPISSKFDPVEGGKWNENLGRKLANVPARTAEILGGLAPAIASGPLAPAVITAQVGEGEYEKSIVAGESPEMANARFQVALPAGYAMSALMPFGGKSNSIVRNAALRAGTGAGTGALGQIGLDLAEQRDINWKEVLKSAETTALLGAVTASRGKGSVKPAKTTSESGISTTKSADKSVAPAIELPAAERVAPDAYELPYEMPEPGRGDVRDTQIISEGGIEVKPDAIEAPAAETATITPPEAATPAETTAPATATTAPLSTLGDLVGKDVTYEGYTGKLIRDAEGNFSVLRDIRKKGDAVEVEIADTGKDPATLASEVGVKPFRLKQDLGLTELPAPEKAIGDLMTLRPEPKGIELIDANEGNVPVKIQRADGTTYDATMNGWQEVPRGAEGFALTPSIGRPASAGISHGNLKPGERIVGEVPSADDFQAYRTRQFQPETINQQSDAALIREKFNGDLPQYQKTPEGELPAQAGDRNLAEQGGEVQKTPQEAIADSFLSRRPREVSTGEGTPTPFESAMIDNWKIGSSEQMQSPEVRAAYADLRAKISSEAKSVRPARGNLSMSRQMSSRGHGGFINLEPVAKAITYGMSLIKQGITTLSDWSNSMVGFFGENIRPKLASLWDAVRRQPRALFGDAKALVDDLEKSDIRSDYEGTFKGEGGPLAYMITPISTRIKRVAPELYGRLMRYESETKQNIARLNRPFGDLYSNLKNILSEQEAGVVGRAALDGDFESIRGLLQGKSIVDPAASAAALSAFDATERVFAVLASEAKKVGAQFEELDSYWPRAINPAKLKEFLTILQKDQPGPFTKAYNEALQKFQEENIKDGLAPAKELPPELAAQVANQVARGFKPGIRDSALSNNFKNRGIIKIPAEYEKFYLDWKQSAQDYVHRTTKLIEKRKFFGSTPDLFDGSVGPIIEKLRFEGRLTPEMETELSKVLESRFGKGESGRMWSSLQKLKEINNVSRLAQIGQAILNMDDPLRSILGNGPLNTVKGLFGKKEITLQDLGLENNLADFNNVDALAKWTKRAFAASGLTHVTRIGQGSALQAGLLNLRQMAKSTGPAFDLFKYKFEPIFGADRFAKLTTDLKENRITTDVKTAALTKMADLFPVLASQQPMGYLNHPNAKIAYQAKSWLLSQMDMYRNMAWDSISNGTNMFNDQLSTPRQKVLGQQLARQGYINLAKLTAMFVLAGGLTNEARKFASGQEPSPLSDYLLDNILYLFGGSKETASDIRKEGLTRAVADAALPSFGLVDRASRDLANLFAGKPTFKSAASIPIIGSIIPKEEKKESRTERKR